MNDFSRGLFTKKKMDEHRRHVKEMGFKNDHEYVENARTLGSKGVGGNICGGRDRNGQIVRYNSETCELFIGNPKTRHIVTYFKVKNGKHEAAKAYMKSHFPDIEIK